MRRLSASVVLAAATSFFFGGCTAQPLPAPLPARETARFDLTCTDVAGLAALLEPGTGLLLGEMHGTEQSPAFVANTACLALRAGLAVTVALEIPRQETSRVEAFLSSSGTQRDRDALLAGPFWRADYQDGRRSEAMFGLLDRLRRLRESGELVRVELLDRAEAPAFPAERDRWMADSLVAAFDNAPGGLVIALMGNVHSRIRRGVPWDPNYEPAGFVLSQAKPELPLTALDVSYLGGEAWTCTTAEASSCKARPLRGRADAPGEGIEIFPEIANGYNGVYRVGELQASPPMVRAGQSVGPVSR